MSASIFDERMKRIKIVTCTRTQAGPAAFLGIPQSEVSEVKQRGKIPAEWLVTLMRVKHVLPEWILTGQGPRYAAALAERY